jgi:hypothetical protein
MTVSINGTSGLTFNDASTQNTAATGFGFKNRIINGAMVIDQRNAGASVSLTGSSVFPVDRMLCFGRASGLGVTGQRSTVAPAGFINSLLYTATTGTAPTGSDYAGIAQNIEGFNIADLGWGTANAQTVTLSFWVRSSVTGTYPFSVHNNAFNRSYVSTYTVNSANAWEYKTITIVGDTSGTWLTDNGVGMRLVWDMGYGFGTTATANAWQAGDLYSLSGNVKLISNAGATFYITGVQLEKGSTATSFDYRSYGTELALCQRYCIVYTQDQDFSRIAPGSSFTTTVAVYQTAFPVEMRAIPTITTTDLSLFRDVFPARVASPSALVWSEGSRKTAGFNTTNTGFTVGQAGWFSTNNANARITFSAEL